MQGMNEHLISIIMPTYNRAAYIRETINSILAQTHTNWELWIEDDGSDDNTEEIINSINDARIHYTRHKRTAVTGTLKNAAIKKSRGSFIAFMDSDDLWPPDKLARQGKLLTDNPDAGFSFTNWRDFYDISKPEKPFYTTISGVEKKQLFADYCAATILANIGTLLCKKECIETVGMFNENRLFTDYSFIGALAYKYPAIIIFEPLLFRRMHATNNVSTNWAEDFYEYQETVQGYIKDGLIQYGQVRDTLFLSHIHLGQKFVAAHQIKQGMRQYLEAWKHKPFSIIPLKKLIKALFL